MFVALMSARRFAALFWCQFFSALNDNLLKQGLVILITLTIAKEQSGALVALAGAVFIAPYFFLSALGGELADKHDKAVVAERVKLAEIGVALVAGAGFYLQSVPLLFVALGLFGCIGALFGPVKYGILPDQLAPEELSAGNALVEGATFLAILGGTMLASFVVGRAIDPIVVSSLILGMAVVCWVSAKLIPTTQAAAPGLIVTSNPLTSTFALLGELKADQRLWVGGHIVSWFWAVGGVALSLLPTLIHVRLGGDEKVIALATAVFTVGIAVGSIVAAKGEPRPSEPRAGAARRAADGDRDHQDRASGARLERACRRRAASRASRLRREPHRRPADDRLFGPGRRGRPLHRALVRRRAGLGAGRPPRARHRRRQCHERGLHGGLGARRRRPAGRGCRRRHAVHPSRPRQSRRHRPRAQGLGA